MFLKHFCYDETAERIAFETGISRQSSLLTLAKLRHRISEWCEEEERLSGEVEVDESYFGARRVRGKRGGGVSGKVPVVGLLKRKGKALSESTVFTDAWRSYDSLILHGYKHYRIHHHENEFARKVVCF